MPLLLRSFLRARPFLSIPRHYSTPATTMSNILHLGSDKNQFNTLINGDKPVLVDFSAM